MEYFKDLFSVFFSFFFSYILSLGYKLTRGTFYNPADALGVITSLSVTCITLQSMWTKLYTNMNY